ncbi:CerR family C-terminal domain-containing protein [Allorhizobium sp. NPDC080224]|uniref:TetR family transcriptional regulator n=2 Tax=Alphaproteobacteria TaxID=28211 RepID=A0A512HKP0_9HYPH|nr:MULTISPECIES: CerR family C-terminal domain-containing protein [Alphaproteobacteria]NTE55339.1 CerR family C-terminal domain-containing protein [Agrobacterium tumefaciens]NTE72757.1 CerR family C-terminal domain-containing protein [Agrobacterium tumefaciens]GEO86017.1 TetR family transcriptional regulator [Ciceribacter naphthalenivorans]GLR23524.1 TetR family transcriptional regulator [Ciceribacter naphthalenivorans]GLT06380.1 TetR family transcriptional regulator [Sphingomonas psychrolutea
MTVKSAESSGHEARSAKTRSLLIASAIEVIGAVGYEGASTRALAKAANTTMSAIRYHFGGKKELYLAAARMIADYAASRFKETGAILETDDPAEKVIRFEEALTNLLRIILEDAEPHSWTSFVARCTYDNDEAFSLIYDRAIAPLVEHLVRAASDFSGRSPGDEALRLRISAIVTAIVSFRFLRGIMLRSMDWKRMQPDCIGQIEDMVRDLCRSDFLAVRLPQ